MRWTALLITACGLGLAAAQPLAAQAWEDYDYENLEFRGVGLDLGWMLPPRVEPALLLGLRVDLGYLGPNVRIRPGVVYWSSDMRQSEIDRLSDQLRNVCLRQRPSAEECPSLNLGRIRMSDLAFNLDAHYEWLDSPFIFYPYLGAGGGIHLLNGRGEAINNTFIEDFLDSISPSINVFGGARIPLTRAFELNAEARYVLASDIRHAAVTVGAVWLISPGGPQGRPVPARFRR